MKYLNIFLVIFCFVFIACQTAPKKETPVKVEKKQAAVKEEKVEKKIEEIKKYNPLNDPDYTFKVVHFEYDIAKIKAEDYEKLEFLAKWLMNFPEIAIKIAGHADERGSVDYNLSLGESRAAKVKEFLAREGINPERITIISYGEESPANSESNESAWAENRRAEFAKLN